MTPTKEEIKAGDYVIDENYKLHIVKSVEERGKGNLRYNFENGRFRLKDETHLGNPNSKIIKLDVSELALQQVAPQWISVEERLPDREEGYPVSRNCFVFDGKKYSMAFYSYAHEQWESATSYDFVDVTHWMPLPKPPAIEHLTEKLDDEK